MTTQYQTLQDPRTKQVQAIDLSQSNAHQEIAKLYKQGWRPVAVDPNAMAEYRKSQETQQTFAQQQAAKAAAPASQPVSAPSTAGPLAQFVKDGQIDLVQVAASHNQAAINAAWQQYGKDTMSTAVLAAKKPATTSAYLAAGSGMQQDLRIVLPVSLSRWNKALREDDTDFLLSHYPKAKGVKAAAASQLGPGVLGRTAQYEASTWESLTPWKEEKGEKATTKRVLAWEADIVKQAVPGYITVTQWDKMATWEKAASVALDLLIVGSVARGVVRGGVRSLAPVLRRSKDAKVVVQAAERSGQAHAELQKATTALRDLERVVFKAPGSGQFSGKAVLEKVAARSQGAPASTGRLSVRARAQAKLQEHISAVQRAAEESRMADEGLLKSLSSVKTLREADIAKIQKLSGIKGLKSALMDVGKYQRQLEKQWRALVRWEKAYGFKGPGGKFDAADEAVYGRLREWHKRLTSIQDTRSRLSRAMVRYHETVQPRAAHTPADEFKGWGMQWTGGGGTAPAPAPAGLADEYGDFLKGIIREKELKDFSAAVRRKQSALWESREPSPVATAEKPKAGTGQHTLQLSPEYGPAKAEGVLEMSVPTVKGSRLGMAKAELAMDRAVEISRMTPAAIRQATPAVVSQFHALRTISSAMGKPVVDIDTKAELRTAAQVNAQYQAAMLAGLEAAQAAYTNTMAGTDNEALAKINAQAAAMAAINAAVKVQPQAQTQTKVSTTVKTAVRTEARAAVSKLIPHLKGLPDSGSDTLQIEAAEGIPRDAGVLTWNEGTHRVEIHPPYREGPQDVSFELLKEPERGKGSPEATLRVLDGDAPKTLTLRRGWRRTTILGGKTMRHSKRKRGPKLLTKSGRVVQRSKARKR